MSERRKTGENARCIVSSRERGREIDGIGSASLAKRVRRESRRSVWNATIRRVFEKAAGETTGRRRADSTGPDYREISLNAKVRILGNHILDASKRDKCGRLITRHAFDLRMKQKLSAEYVTNVTKHTYKLSAKFRIERSYLSFKCCLNEMRLKNAPEKGRKEARRGRTPLGALRLNVERFSFLFFFFLSAS